MNEHPCIRCHHPVLLEDGHLVYCSHCGAPQIFLSSDLQEQIASDARAYAERNAPAPEQAATGPEKDAPARRRWAFHRAQGGDPSQQAWPLAIEYALLSAGIALALSLLTLILPPVGILAWLWVVSAPILTVGFYNARSREMPPSSGFAARLGLLTGLLVSSGCAVVITLSLVLTRFVFHTGAALDHQFAEAIAQAGANAAARYGAAVQPAMHLLSIPEYRVGMLLWMAAMAFAGYLLVSAVAAGLAGVLLGRRRGV